MGILISCRNQNGDPTFFRFPVGIKVGVLISCKDQSRGSGLDSSVRRAPASKLRGPGFESRPGTVGGPVSIIMLGARPC